jgi:hypothetical protein
LLHPVTWGVLWRWLKFQTCTNILNTFFKNFGHFFVPPHICFRLYLIMACEDAEIWSTIKNKCVVQMVVFHLFMPV